MVKTAWKEVLPLTIEHCWAHTGIQRLVSCATAFTYNWKLTRFHSQPYNPAAIPAHMNPNAWDLLRKFASSDSLTLPEVEAQLQSLLGQRYVDNDWQPALKAIMDAEGDIEAAIAAIEKLADEAAQNSRLKTRLPRCLEEQPSNPAPQLTAIEKDLMASVEELQKRKRIFGEPPTMEDLIQPPEERDGDIEEIEACDEVEIVAEIKQRISIESREIIEVESDSDADAKDDPFPDIALADAIAMCEKLEKACIMLGYADGDMGLTLPQELRHFRGYLRQRESRNAKQITLTELWRK